MFRIHIITKGERERSYYVVDSCAHLSRSSNPILAEAALVFLILFILFSQ